MPRIDFEGLEELIQAVGGISKIPDDVQDEAITKMAELAKEKIKQEGEAQGVRDDESSEHILDVLTIKKIEHGEDGAYTYITFAGKRQRGKTKTRNAEIAFINEFGKQGQPARPFMKCAMEKNADKITSQGADIIGDWLEKNFKK